MDQIIGDAELERMTVKELMDLKAKAEAAIRARIREKQQAKIAQSPFAGTAGAGSGPADLEREFQVWVKRRG